MRRNWEWSFEFKLSFVHLSFNAKFMDIQLEKKELMKLLADTENPSIITEIKKIFQREKKDWWDELSVEQKEAIEEGERQVENGEFVTLEEMMAHLK